MPKVAVDNSPLQERAIFGYDGADYRVVKVDTSGNLVAAVLADQNVQARGHGWIGAAWQKQPLALGYSAIISDDFGLAASPAGDQTLLTTAVPAGEIHIIDALSGRNQTRVIAQVVFLAVVGGVTVALDDFTPTAALTWLTWNGQLVLAPGDQVGIYFRTQLLNDVLDARMCGRRIDIDQ